VVGRERRVLGCRRSRALAFPLPTPGRRAAFARSRFQKLPELFSCHRHFQSINHRQLLPDDDDGIVKALDSTRKIFNKRVDDMLEKLQWGYFVNVVSPATLKTRRSQRQRLHLAAMRQFSVAIFAAAAMACGVPSPAGSYLFVWAGDKDRTASDFLGVIDANPASPKYGAIVASLATGESKTFPHHTEQEMPANEHLLANGFGAGKSWLFDLSEPATPKILTSFGARAGFTHPHSYVRLPNGEVLATFQYGEGQPVSAEHDHGTASTGAAGDPKGTEAPKPAPLTGGLVWMTERGDVVRSATAQDSSSAFIYPYHVVALPGIDRALSSTTDMDDGNKPATSEWVQLWRLSDLKLLKTFALQAGPRGDEHRFTGELRLLPDGKSVYVHTFNCGLYLIRDLDKEQPRASFVTSFTGHDCGVPVVTGHFWLQPVPSEHALVSLDISDPEHPREVSRVAFGDDEGPHWASLNTTGRRVVVNSAGSKPNRLYIVDVDPATGKLVIDARFKDAGAAGPGVSLTGKAWPHGFSGTARPHGTVFSRR